MIEKMINDALLAEQEKRKGRVRSNKWAPSSLGKCYRAQFWNRKNEPITNPPDLRGLQRMAQGKWTHTMIQSYLNKDITEVKVETEDILGFCDINLDKIWDIKCCDEWQFKRYHNIPTPRFFEHNEHMFLQVGSYSKHLDKKNIVIRSNIFGSFTHKDHEIEYDKIAPKVDLELETLRRYWKEDKLPLAKARLYNGHECNYCNWKKKCEELNA